MASYRFTSEYFGPPVRGALACFRHSSTFRRRLRALLVREHTALGHVRPEHAAEQLHLLIEGTLVMGATQDSHSPARAARDLAALVLD